MPRPYPPEFRQRVIALVRGGRQVKQTALDLGIHEVTLHSWLRQDDIRMLERIHPKTAGLLADAKEDLLAFTGFPRAHWRQIWSTNPLERLNREIKRRTDVVGVFPNPEALLRLTTAVLMEQHDEWAASNRRYLSKGSLKALTEPEEIDQGVIRQFDIA